MRYNRRVIDGRGARFTRVQLRSSCDALLYAVPLVFFEICAIIPRARLIASLVRATSDRCYSTKRWKHIFQQFYARYVDPSEWHPPEVSIRESLLPLEQANFQQILVEERCWLKLA